MVNVMTRISDGLDPLLFDQVFCSLGDNGGFSGARPCKTDAGTCSMGDCPGLSFTQTHRLFLQFLYCRMDAFDGFFFSKNLQDLGCTCRCCLFTGKSSTDRPHDIPGLISMFFTECYQCLKQCIVAVIIPVPQAEEVLLLTGSEKFPLLSSFFCGNTSVYHTPELLHKKSISSLISGNTSIRVLTMRCDLFQIQIFVDRFFQIWQCTLVEFIKIHRLDIFTVHPS